MNLLTLKTNVLGTVAIAILSSALTVVLSQWLGNGSGDAERSVGPSAALSAAPSAVGTDILVCGEQVYSPVQRRCVDQQIFDAEMKRLFAALGLDAGIYQTGAAADGAQQN